MATERQRLHDADRSRPGREWKRSLKRALCACFALMPLSMPAAGWECIPFGLKNDYHRSDNVFIASITRCQVLDDDNWSIPFEVKENFKGETTFTSLTPTGAGIGEQSCLELGREYLLFLPKTGKFSRCPRAQLLSGDSNSRPERYAQVLRAFKSGSIPSITEPWLARESDRHCGLSRRLSTRGDRLDADIFVSAAKQESESFTSRCSASDSESLTIVAGGQAALGGSALILRVGEVITRVDRVPSGGSDSNHYCKSGTDVRQLVESLTHAEHLRISNADAALVGEPIVLSLRQED